MSTDPSPDDRSTVQGPPPSAPSGTSEPDYQATLPVDPLATPPVSPSPSGFPPVEAYQPPEPPRAPTYSRGYARPPQRDRANPPTAEFPTVSPHPPHGPRPPAAPPGCPTHGRPSPDYPAAAYEPTTYDPNAYLPYPPVPRRGSNAPLIGVIIAVALLLVAGGVTAGVLVTRNLTGPAAEPTARARPTITAPAIPTLPTDLPELSAPMTVKYEVTGDGPVEIIYTGKLGDGPKRLNDIKLPWRLTLKIDTAAFISVTAVRTSPRTGKIHCRATVDGKEVAQSTREGLLATVTCNKLVFR